MLADLLAVEVDLRLIERCLELEKHALARPGRRDGEVFPVPTIAHVECRRCEVGQTERMRQTDVAPRRIIEGGRLRARDIGAFELPGLVEVLDKTETIGLSTIVARRSARARLSTRGQSSPRASTGRATASGAAARGNNAAGPAPARATIRHAARGKAAAVPARATVRIATRGGNSPAALVASRGLRAATCSAHC